MKPTTKAMRVSANSLPAEFRRVQTASAPSPLQAVRIECSLRIRRWATILIRGFVYALLGRQEDRDAETPVNLSDAAGRTWAMFFARSILGLIFFMAGFWKVFELGPLEHARRLFIEPYAQTVLPRWSLWATGTTVPFVELIAGALVLVGWHTRVALLALGGVLILVTFGHLVLEPLYEFHTHVIPRAALLLFLLAMPQGDDKISVNHWLESRRSKD